MQVEKLRDDLTGRALGEVEARAIGALVAAAALRRVGVGGLREQPEDVAGAGPAGVAPGAGEHGVMKAERAGAQSVTRPQHVGALVAPAELGGDRRHAQREGREGQRGGDGPHAPAVRGRQAFGFAARHLSPGPDEHGRGRDHQHDRLRREPPEHGHAGGEQADQREQAGADDHQRLDGPGRAVATGPAAQQRGAQGEGGEQDRHRARAYPRAAACRRGPDRPVQKDRCFSTGPAQEFAGP